MCPSPERRGQTRFDFGPLNDSCLSDLARSGPTHIAVSGAVNGPMRVLRPLQGMLTASDGG